MPVTQRHPVHANHWKVRAHRVAAVLVAVLFHLACVGCQYEGIRQAQAAHRAARPEIARAELAQFAGRGFADRHEILAWLELGTAQHETGAFQKSSEAMLRAEAGFDAQDARPETSITEEVFASITSPLSVAYRGSPTDRVMAPAYRAINAMLLGDDATARSALNEAAIRQSLSIERRSAAIEQENQRARSLASGNRAGIDLSRSVRGVQNDPAIAAEFASLRAFEPYRGYVNPFAEMLHAVFRLAAPRDAADRDRGIALLRSVAGTVDNAYVTAALDDESSDREPRPSVHVFFATGFCPWREEFRLDLPLFLVNDRVDYVGVSFPTLAFDADAVGWLNVETPDGISRTQLLADMDRLMASEFKEELPALLTRAIIATAVKTGASYGINEATRGESEGEQAANAIARIAAGLYLASQNRADTRSWATLPKCYQYARVQAPSAGEILLSTPDGQSAFIDVQPDSDTIVFVRSLRPGVRLQVRSVGFGSGGASGRHDALDARGRTNPSETELDRTERNSNDERIDVYTEAKTR